MISLISPYLLAPDELSSRGQKVLSCSTQSPPNTQSNKSKEPRATHMICLDKYCPPGMATYLWPSLWGQASCAFQCDSWPRSSTDRFPLGRPLRWWRQDRTWCPTLQRTSRSSHKGSSHPEARRADYRGPTWWFSNFTLVLNHDLKILTLHRAPVNS